MCGLPRSALKTHQASASPPFLGELLIFFFSRHNFWTFYIGRVHIESSGIKLLIIYTCQWELSKPKGFSSLFIEVQMTRCAASGICFPIMYQSISIIAHIDCLGTCGESMKKFSFTARFKCVCARLRCPAIYFIPFANVELYYRLCVGCGMPRVQSIIISPCVV